MRALVNTRYGGPEVLAVEERADPLPGADEVLIRVKRAGLNFSDVQARVGLYPDAPRPPMVMGYEVSGTVEAVGPGVTGLEPGASVFAVTRFGGQASRVVVSAANVQPLPPSMSFDEGAALPINYLTAYHMLFRVAPLFPGMKVLIHMAAGGVGLAAIQLCRTVEGVELFGTASAGKHDFLRRAGLHHPIDYHQVDYEAEVNRLTQGKGVDVVLDPLGGKDWSKGYRLLKKGGHLVCFGFANVVASERRSLLNLARQYLATKSFSPLALVDENRSVSGVNLGHLWDERALLAHHMARLLELGRAGRVKPVIDRVFPLSAAADAHRWMQGRKNVGKVLFDCEA